MPLFGPVWRKHGERRNRECVAQWRFEGRYILPTNIYTTLWRAFNSDIAFRQIYHDSSNWNTWDIGGSTRSHSRCLSTMVIRRVRGRIHENTMPHPFNFSIYRDRDFPVMHIRHIPQGWVGSFELFVEQPLAFDSEYALALKTTDGSIPADDQNNEQMTMELTFDIDLGAGDP